MSGPSLNPDSFSGGGFFEEGFYRVQEARFTRQGPENYNVDRTFAKLRLAPEEGGEVREQYWSASDPKDFIPSDDGRTLVQVGRKTALNDNSNFAELMRSYVAVGMDKGKLSDDLAASFEGAVLYMVLQDAPERGGMAPQIDPQTGQPRKTQIVVVGEIKELPGQTSAQAAAPAGPPSQRGRAATGGPQGRQSQPASAPASAPATNGNAAAEEAKAEVISFLMETLGAEGALERGVVTTRAMQKYGTDSRRAAIIGLLNNKAHLDSLVADGLIVLEGTTIGLP